MAQTTDSYADYYAARLAEGHAFEAYIYQRLYSERGIDVVPASWDDQKYGENRTGIEVKLDNKLHRTGNIYLEIAEKSHPSRSMYVPSGIARRDNTWLIVIGNYQEAFAFGKTHLQAVVKNSDLQYRQTKTSLGYLLPLKQARKLAELTFKGDG